MRICELTRVKKKKKKKEMPLKHLNLHGLVSRAREVLDAEAGEQVWVYVRQEGQELDLEPELDEVRVLQVLLGQRRRRLLTEDLLKINHYLPQVLLRGRGN